MPDSNDKNDVSNEGLPAFDYTQVHNPARIAVYDDFKSPPRIVIVEPTTTNEFIENLASRIYELSIQQQGRIAYTVIREVTENFIHAQFSEIVVSIYDQGNTIRFSDQGPGISDKDRAQMPGYTSAIEPMKRYIRGVGSGLPTVKDYLSFSHGNITIDDNIGKGAIVTISLLNNQKKDLSLSATVQNLNMQERTVLSVFKDDEILGITDIVNLTGMAQSSVSYQLNKLTDAGFVEKTASKKRKVTELGLSIVSYLVSNTR